MRRRPPARQRRCAQRAPPRFGQHSPHPRRPGGTEEAARSVRHAAGHRQVLAAPGQFCSARARGPATTRAPPRCRDGAPDRASRRRVRAACRGSADISRSGVVGEHTTKILIYRILTTGLLEQRVSAARIRRCCWRTSSGLLGRAMSTDDAITSSTPTTPARRERQARTWRRLRGSAAEHPWACGGQCGEGKAEGGALAGALDTVIWPPCSSTNERVRASPRPVPPPPGSSGSSRGRTW